MKPLLCFALVTLLFTSQAAFADEPAATQPTSNSIEDKIANTSLSYGVAGGFGVRIWGSDDNIDIAQGAVHVSFPLMRPIGSSWYRGVLEYNVELNGGVITNFNDHGFVGLTPVGLRYNFTAAGKVVPYWQGMLGLAYIDVPEHIQGTRFCFTQNAAVGVKYYFRPDMALDLQARYTHISNAGIEEPNPGMNEGFLLAGIDFY